MTQPATISLTTPPSPEVSKAAGDKLGVTIGNAATGFVQDLGKAADATLDTAKTGIQATQEITTDIVADAEQTAKDKHLFGGAVAGAGYNAGTAVANGFKEFNWGGLICGLGGLLAALGIGKAAGGGFWGLGIGLLLVPLATILGNQKLGPVLNDWFKGNKAKSEARAKAKEQATDQQTPEQETTPEIAQAPAPTTPAPTPPTPPQTPAPTQPQASTPAAQTNLAQTLQDIGALPQPSTERYVYRDVTPATLPSGSQPLAIVNSSSQVVGWVNLT